MGDSPQTGPPQPPESPSPPLRVAPHGKTRRPLVGKEVGKKRKKKELGRQEARKEVGQKTQRDDSTCP